MAAIVAEVRGHEKLKKSYAKMSRRIKSGTKTEMQAVAKLLKNDVTRFIKRITGSRVETRYNPARQVTVSNPRAYPNDDLGGLVRGIKTMVISRGRGNYIVMFKSTAKYSLDLEYGTRKMKARPFMRPTLKRNRKKITRMLNKSLKNAL